MVCSLSNSFHLTGRPGTPGHDGEQVWAGRARLIYGSSVHIAEEGSGGATLMKCQCCSTSAQCWEGSRIPSGPSAPPMPSFPAHARRGSGARPRGCHRGREGWAAPAQPAEGARAAPGAPCAPSGGAQLAAAGGRAGNRGAQGDRVSVSRECGAGGRRREGCVCAGGECTTAAE